MSKSNKHSTPFIFPPSTIASPFVPPRISWRPGNESPLQPNEITNNAPPQSKTLKLMLPASANDIEQDQYALVPIPSTYEEAQKVAARVFGTQLGDDVNASLITLRCSIKNRDGNWCWGNIIPESWKLTMEDSAANEVGVFYAGLKSIPMHSFTVGKIGLAIGERTSTGISWNVGKGQPKSEVEVSVYMIDRPSSYEEAVTTIFKGGLPFESRKHYLTAEDLMKQRIKFYTFSSVRVADKLPLTCWWTEFPEEAHSNVDLWRKLVPKAGQLLGYTIEDSPPIKFN